MPSRRHYGTRDPQFDRFFLEDNTGLRGSSAEFVGAGWNAAVILWNGSKSLRLAHRR
ncbi:MAG: hypothetical protein U0670_19530 [Anaerolineae bacterium]